MLQLLTRLVPRLLGCVAFASGASDRSILKRVPSVLVFKI